MPYIPVKRQYDKSRKLLNAYEINATKLMAILDCSRPTARKKIDNPGELTTDDWLHISKKGHVPVEEIRLVFLS